MKPSFVRIFIKDLFDFVMILSTTLALTFGIYLLLPSFSRIDLSFYFFEQNIELFFVNPQLILWFLGMSLGVTVIYFLFGHMLYQSTFGGVLMRIMVVDMKTEEPPTMMQTLAMAIGAYVGVMAFFVGPLSAWWLDEKTRGWSEKWSKCALKKKPALVTVDGR